MKGGEKIRGGLHSRMSVTRTAREILSLTVHSTWSQNVACNGAIHHSLVLHEGRWNLLATLLGQKGPFNLLYRSSGRINSAGCGFPPSRTHAALEQYLPQYGVPCDLHAAQIPILRNPAQDHQAQELSRRLEPHGTKVSSLRHFIYRQHSSKQLSYMFDPSLQLSHGESRRAGGQLGQLRHLLGENGDRPEATLRPPVPQFLFTVLARAGHLLPDVQACPEHATQPPRKRAGVTD